MLILEFLVLILTVYIVVDKCLEIRSRRQTQYNSSIFHKAFTDIWKRAAKDWLEDPEDSRNFDDFFKDTADLIFKSQR